MIEKAQFEIDIKWNSLIGKIIKNSGYTMKELYSMTINDFFITLNNWQKDLEYGQ